MSEPDNTPWAWTHVYNSPTSKENNAMPEQPKHTPGAVRAAEEICGQVYGYSKRFATAYGLKTVEGIADLIDRETAAPKLLAACKAFVAAWEKCMQLEKTETALRLARAAIAKAERQ